MGLLVRGTYDDNDKYWMDYCIPYFTGNVERLYEDLEIERHAEKESYSGLCDDINLGASLIFYLQNVTEYFNKKRYGRSEKNVARVALSGLSVEGKILFPVYQKMPVMSEIKASQERKKMLQAARDGDEDAIENLTLEELSAHFFLSSSYLCRIFKATTGTTINKYITAKRITLSKSLLDQGCSVLEACEACGFNDYSNYLRAFTKAVGISPKKYAQFHS